MFNKPVIAISYDPKNDALLESCGLGEYCQQIESVDLANLIAQFIRLESRADHLRVGLQRKTDENRSLLKEQYREILKEFGTGPDLMGQVEPGRVSI
jgi:polysaccharide pyruvyl transferase WcaK-like protein